MSNLIELTEKYATEEAGHRFQSEFAKFVASEKHSVVVETGAGISTLFLLNEMTNGNLYSVDTKPWCGFEVNHPNYELILDDSLNALLPLFLKTGGWDFFLHDGNHDIKRQTYEYNFAYACLNPGGYIASDDYSWGEHKAWQVFLENHDLKAVKMGDIEIAKKPFYIQSMITLDTAKSVHKNCTELAEVAEAIWLEWGNKNSDIKWDIRV